MTNKTLVLLLTIIGIILISGCTEKTPTPDIELLNCEYEFLYEPDPDKDAYRYNITLKNSGDLHGKVNISGRTNTGRELHTFSCHVPANDIYSARVIWKVDAGEEIQVSLDNKKISCDLLKQRW